MCQVCGLVNKAETSTYVEFTLFCVLDNLVLIYIFKNLEFFNILVLLKVGHTCFRSAKYCRNSDFFSFSADVPKCYISLNIFL